MKAALWYRKHDLRIEEIPKPKKPASGEVVVKVKFCGICGSDLHEYTDGPQYIPKKPHPLTGTTSPLILGHEFSGEIVELGQDVKDWKVGDRVVIMPALFCGKCYFCLRGLQHQCKTCGASGLSWYWGGLSEYTIVKDYELVRMPDALTYEEGAVIEPATVAVYSVDRGGVRLGDKVFITGDGPIGCLMAMAVKAAGVSEIYMTAKRPGRFKFLKELDIATALYNPFEDKNYKDRILEATNGIGVDVAIECAGKEKSINDCFDVLRRRGTYVQVGLNVGNVQVNPWLWAHKEFTMIGIWAYHIYDFSKAIDLVTSGKFPVKKVITKIIKLDDIVADGFERLIADKEGREIKVIVSLDS
jgi:(R,R)-butanediol dehydrogenase / meso-butanediol dehydrogenase / diacetyl reductase